MAKKMTKIHLGGTSREAYLYWTQLPPEQRWERPQWLTLPRNLVSSPYIEWPPSWWKNLPTGGGQQS